jgi:endonuclease IV
MHLNDSKKGLNSRLDRHENIGKGEIGLECFRTILNDPRFENIPLVLETEGPWDVEINLLRSLIRENTKTDINKEENQNVTAK